MLPWRAACAARVASSYALPALPEFSEFSYMGAAAALEGMASPRPKKPSSLAAAGAPVSVAPSGPAAAAFSDHYQQASADDEAPLELTTQAVPASHHRQQTPQQTPQQAMGPQEVAAFAAKFKGWRKN